MSFKTGDTVSRERYAACVMVSSNEGTETSVRMRLMFFDAISVTDAECVAMAVALNEYPTDEGYENHRAVVSKVSMGGELKSDEYEVCNVKL